MTRLTGSLCMTLLVYEFPDKFIEQFMACITSPRFTVKLNGEGHDYLAGNRGLRQGDPMSPLFFVLVMEYLSRTLKCMSELPDFHYDLMY